jgi:hypothetical protein
MNTIELKRYEEEPLADDARFVRQIVAMRQREALLRARLIDARDALVRQEVGWRPPDAAPGTTPTGEPPSLRRYAGRDYARVRRSMTQVLRNVIPRGATTLVISRGDPQLLETVPAGERRHFPQDPEGDYAGHHPRDGAAAIAEIENQRSKGAEFLVLPATAMWWLDHYHELARHLQRYPRLIDDPRTCVVHDLRPRGAERAQRDHPGEQTSSSPKAAEQSPLAAVSIISRNYLPQARILARSFRAHEPNGRFYLLVVDRLPEGAEVGADVRLIDPEELDIPGFYEMCFKYDIVEFNTAVKPFLLSLLMDRYGEEDIAYFDPDIIIMRPLDELRTALQRGNIVLTPHIMKPVPQDGEKPSEQDIMVSGAYNLGFIAVRRSQEVRDFLHWWQERLEDGCRIDIRSGLFTDQKWIDLVPSLFPGTTLLRDPTYNVAFWNLHEREISRDGDTFRVNNRPAAFFHISGFDPAKPTVLSKHQTRTKAEPGSALASLLRAYADALMANGYEECSGWTYGYERFEDGTRVHPLLRQIYLNLKPEERRRFGDPFSTGGTQSFLEWATRPREDGRLSRFLESVYRMRYDLPLAFPDIDGRDRPRFLNWARRWGCAEMGFDAGLVRNHTAGEQQDAARATRTRAAASGNEGAARQDDGLPGNDPSARRPAGKRGGPMHEKLRPSANGYEAMIQRVQDIARTTLPAGSRVLVVSKGDYRLVELGGCEGWHFPQTDEGVYGGFHPPDSPVAIAHLEGLRKKGAGYLLIPRTALWWLEYYEDFRHHLESRYRVVVREHDSCVIYALRESAIGVGGKPHSRPHGNLRRWWRRLGDSLATVHDTGASS